MFGDAFSCIIAHANGHGEIIETVSWSLSFNSSWLHIFYLDAAYACDYESVSGLAFCWKWSLFPLCSSD